MRIQRHYHEVHEDLRNCTENRRAGTLAAVLIHSKSPVGLPCRTGLAYRSFQGLSQ